MTDDALEQGRAKLIQHNAEARAKARAGLRGGPPPATLPPPWDRVTMRQRASWLAPAPSTAALLAAMFVPSVAFGRVVESIAVLGTMSGWDDGPARGGWSGFGSPSMGLDAAK